MVQPRAPQPVGRAPGAPLFEGPFDQRFRRPHVVPGIAHVYVTPDGDYMTSERRPNRVEAWVSVKRYDVDMRDGYTELTGELPSAENNFYFPSTLSVTWRVHDQIAIVKHGVADADLVIDQRLSTVMREISSQVAPQDWSVAEARLNRRFAAGVVLPEGLTVLRVSVKLRIDGKLANFLTAKTQTAGDIDIDDMKRVAMMRVLAQGNLGLLAEHLAKNQGATGEVLELITQNHRLDEQERKELRQLLLDKGVIQDVDLEGYRQHVLPPLPGYPAAGTQQSWNPLTGNGIPPLGSVPPPVGAPSPAIEGSGVVGWEPVGTDDPSSREKP